MKQLKDFIRIYEDMFPQELKDRMFEMLETAQAWQPAQISAGFDPSVRDTLTMFLSSPEARAQTPWLDEGIGQVVRSAAERYMQEFPSLKLRGDSGYELLRYPTGGFYAEHVDYDFNNIQRTVSCTITLNDDYKGGEFAFFRGEEIYRPPALSVLMFPSNFQFPHEVKPVTEGERWSIVTWLIG